MTIMNTDELQLIIDLAKRSVDAASTFRFGLSLIKEADPKSPAAAIAETCIAEGDMRLTADGFTDKLIALLKAHDTV